MAGAMTVGELGEEGIIELFVDRASTGDTSGLVVPNGDDAAAWSFLDGASVITTDSLVEAQHFDLAYASPTLVGRKLMAVNLSDLAAMGATPRYALLSVCFPQATPVETARGIAAGVLEMCRTHRVTVIGGNTTGIRGPIVLTATLIGVCEASRLVRRSGARAGDALYVTGTLGDAAAGIHAATAGRFEGAAAPLVAALCDPSPRVEEGRVLARTGVVTAMCDLSDGLGRDVRRLLEYEGLGVRVDVAQLPLSAALREYAAEQGLDAAQVAMAGGEDYELLLTAHPRDRVAVVAACRARGTLLTPIGEITATSDALAVHPDGRTAPLPTGFEHYGQDG